MNTAKTEDSEFTLTYGFRAVAFLDLLGQRERLVEIEGILDRDRDASTNETLKTTLRDTVGVIWKFRKVFSQFFDQFSNRQSAIQAPEEIKERLRQMGIGKIHFQSFSDSMVAWSALGRNSEVEYAQACKV